MKANQLTLNHKNLDWGKNMSEKTLQMIVRLRDGTEVAGAISDVSDKSEESLRDSLEGLSEILRNVKHLDYLSLNLETHGTVVIHPDDISYVRLHGSTFKLRKMVQEYL